MTWKDRDQFEPDPSDRLGRPGGDWRGIRATLDNPMSWSLPAGRVWGIVIRIHIVFLFFVVVELARSLGSPSKGEVAPLGFWLVAMRMAALFLVVLMHEFGHCLACRRVDGTADEILMWPLGGLAYCQPPNRWMAHLVTVVGGPAVNVAICLVLGTILTILTGHLWAVGIPNPLSYPGYDQLQVGGMQPMWLMALFTIHDVSFMLLLFNLLPVFPLDGGRIVQALLWRNMGYVRSMRWAVRVGYFGAIALGLFGAIKGHWLLVGIAFFGGVTCYITHKQLEWTQTMMGFEDDEYAQSLHGDDEPEDAGPSRAERREARQAERVAQEEAQIDQILAKIGTGGMESLTGREKRILKRASQRKQQEQ